MYRCDGVGLSTLSNQVQQTRRTRGSYLPADLRKLFVDFMDLSDLGRVRLRGAYLARKTHERK